MIDTRFSFFTASDGTQFQVLRFVDDPETGEEMPVDWDEQASAELMREHEAKAKAE